MANPHNNTGITDDDITRANKYKDALDSLKNSINGVNSKLPEFADGLQAGLKAIGEKLPEVVDAMVKLNVQNKKLQLLFSIIKQEESIFFHRYN